ncbi:MAG TPA: MFS transporter [Candidatus Marinimicrobia bacterium]|nr:MFS transporter [Candidatus Neomarinimicrobiota bacterium]
MLRNFLFPVYEESGSDGRRIRSMLIMLSMVSFMSHQMWRSVFNNFAVEVAGINAAQMGIIQSVREVPGFLALLVIFVIIFIQEQYLAFLSLALMGLGILLTGFFPDFGGLIFTVLMMSVGFHYFETVNQSLTLQHIPKSELPRFMGQVRSYGSLGDVFGFLAVLILLLFLPYKYIYLIAGLLVIAAVAYGFWQYPLFMPKVVQRKKMVLRKRYWLYYLLTFLSGARRQIFTAFAVFLMVQKFAFSVKTITILFLINSIINMFWAPLIGRMLDYFGERVVISIEYTGLIFVFAGYAFTQSVLMVAALYIFDHLFFNMSIAIRTYFQKIADPADIAPTMAVGFTINHIAAVLIPVTGGLIWMIDYRYTFLMGALLALASLISAQFVKTAEFSE